MEKGEIARYEQFLLFLQCFQKACFQEVSKGVIVWERIKELTLYLTILTSYDPEKEIHFGKLVGKGEGAGISFSHNDFSLPY